MKALFFFRNLVRDSKFQDNPRGAVKLLLIVSLCVVFVLAGIAFWLFYGQPGKKHQPQIATARHKNVQTTEKFDIPVQPSSRPSVVEPKMPRPATPTSNPPAHEADEPKKAAAKTAAPSEVGEGIGAVDTNDFQMQDLPPEDGPRTETAPSASKQKPTPSASHAGGNKETAAQAKAPSEEKPASPTGGEPATGSAKPGVPGTGKSTKATKAQETGIRKPPRDSGEERVVIVQVGNVREGPSTSKPVLLTVDRGNRLRVTERKGNWYAVVLENGQSGWVHHSLVGDPGELAPRKAKAGSKKTAKSLIKGIRTVVTDPNRAQIIFELNGNYPPEIMVLEGKKPRVVCDFYGAKLGSSAGPRVRAGNSVVEKIRIGVHKGQKPKVRVVLDLTSGQDYSVEQFFFEKEKYYALMINTDR